MDPRHEPSVLVDNLCLAFESLKTNVIRVINTQVGDSRHILRQRRECEIFTQHIEHAWVSSLFSMMIV